MECLAARAAGGSRKDAATLLGISPRTVAHHLRNLLIGSHCADDGMAIYMYRREIEELIAQSHQDIAVIPPALHVINGDS